MVGLWVSFMRFRVMETMQEEIQNNTEKGWQGLCSGFGFGLALGFGLGLSGSGLGLGSGFGFDLALGFGSSLWPTPHLGVASEHG